MGQNGGNVLIVFFQNDSQQYKARPGEARGRGGEPKYNI